MIHRTDVSMLSEARDAQFTPLTFLGPGTLVATAPAKVNLVLAVGERGADGYHAVTTVLHALALNDRMYVHRESGSPATAPAPEPLPAGGPAENLQVTIEIVDRVNPVPLAATGRDNLIWRAFDELACALEYRQPESLAVRLEKHIPVQAGLGGGSSDGAAALAVACRLWDVPLADPRVVATAQRLGADVAFFLHGGCGLYAGRGGDLVRPLTPATTTLVLVKQPTGVSTAAAYAAFDEAPTPLPADFERQLADVQAAAGLPLFNNLESAAERVNPALAEVRSWLHTQPGVAETLLCGSGSAFFATVDTLDAAMALASAAGANGWWSRVTTLAPWGVVVRDA